MKYYTVTYEVEGPDIADAAHNIAIGQSIGNPNIRSEIENAPNIKAFEALVDSIDGNTVKIKYPLDAFIWPNISQLLCIIQGGQSDIACVERCRVVDIQGLPYMNEPVLGMKAFKERVGAENRPLFGAIVKPKSGLNVDQLVSIVTEMIDGGFFEDLWKSATQGWAAGASVNESFDIYKKGANVSDEELQAFIDAAIRMNASGPTHEQLMFQKEVEKNGGSPSSSNKLHAAKEALKAAGGVEEEPIVDDWKEDDAVAQADEEE